MGTRPFAVGALRSRPALSTWLHRRAICVVMLGAQAGASAAERCHAFYRHALPACSVGIHRRTPPSACSGGMLVHRLTARTATPASRRRRSVCSNRRDAPAISTDKRVVPALPAVRPCNGRGSVMLKMGNCMISRHVCPATRPGYVRKRLLPAPARQPVLAAERQHPALFGG